MEQKLSWCRKCFLLFVSGAVCTLSSFAQSSKIKGVVEDRNGDPLVGASISVKGTTNVAISDIDGNFTINAVLGTILEISSIGYEKVEMNAVSGMKVSLSEDAQEISDVVVTAMGITREKKTLGYAVQDVKGDILLEKRDVNVVNSLSGEIAGLQVLRSSNGPAGSSKILLRGSSSLTGDNQPLIVIDGVPMDNFTGSEDLGFFNGSLDMGNGLQDINPEDVASVSVLKGASAAALYGSRAGNGVILITTKSGRSGQGLGISISSTVSFENIFMRPPTQNKYGQGDNGVADNIATGSWGLESETYDNVSTYIQTGVNATESITLQQKYGETAVYTSITRTDNKSMLPGATMSRTNLSTRASTYFGKDKKLFLDTKVQYINNSANNRIINGADNSTYNMLYNMPRSIDINNWRNPVDQDGNMKWWKSGDPSYRNPYWSKEYDLNEDSRDRFIMFGSLKYFFTDWLDLEAKAGSDMYFIQNNAKMYGGSAAAPTGRYSQGKKQFVETNYSFLLTARKDNLIDRFGGMFAFGGNLMNQQSSGISGDAGELNIPNIFSLNNGKNAVTINESFAHKKINSLYGSLQLNWDAYLFLDLTLRNDWSSTLSKENRSFYYPSISGSWVVTDMLNRFNVDLPAWFSLAKFRASWAQVGNDLPAYQLYNVYSAGKDPTSNPTINKGNTLYDPTVKNELITSFEVGGELKFFNNRLGVDAAYYKSNAINQLLNLPIDANRNNGYSFKKINAGNIQNQGVEIQVFANIIKTRDFIWDAKLNFSNNINTVVELHEDAKRYSLVEGLESLKVFAIEGQKFGQIYGTKYKRVIDPNSPYYDQIIVDGDGLPLSDEKSEYLGNQQSSVLMGFGNTFTYKGISLGILIDARFGGQMFSATHQTMQNYGTAAITEDRAQRIVPGVTEQIEDDGTKVYVPNEKSVTAQQYWKAITERGNKKLGINEANMYDATNIRIRNISLSYELNRSWLKKTPFQRIKLGVMCSNVFMLYSKMGGIDPESVFNAASNATGVEVYSPPTSRTYVFNLTIGF